LVHNEKRGAASLKPPPNAYCLAEARMKSVGDACFSLLFAGSMLGHKNIQHTVRYTELSPTRFKDFWRD
jgi:hypothetical protein